MDNALVKEYGKEKIWLNWRLEARDQGGTPKLTKVPYKHDGSFGSSTDPSTWADYETCDSARPSFPNGGVGIVFEALDIVAVDIDHVIREDGTFTDERIAAFTLIAQTYTERSPSKTGLHAFFKMVSPTTGQSFHYRPHLNRTPKDYRLKGFPAVEIYSEGRYFTFTGDTLNSLPVRKVSEDDLEAILDVLGYPWPKDANARPQSSAPSIALQPSTLDDETLLQKMFSSRNGLSVKSLWDGNLADYSDDHSAADLGLCSHLAFWLGKDFTRIEKAWMSSPLGSREKTKTRTDYRKRTIDKAIESCSEVYSVGHEVHANDVNSEEVTRVLDLLEYEDSKKGRKYYTNEDNVIRIFREDKFLKSSIRFNSFSHMYETNMNIVAGKKVWEELSDVMITNAMAYIQKTYQPHFSNVSFDKVRLSLKAIAHENSVNPVRDYFAQFVWDGRPRLASWLYRVYGTPDDPLHQTIGANWLKGMMKRIVSPGCKYDEVLVLEGPQGWRKTTSLAMIGGQWHVETSNDVTGPAAKDFSILLAHNVIIELAEGETLSKTAAKEMKVTLSKTEDQIRLPYESGWSHLKRHCVFAMTTNDSEYLKDDTGNRRFLPVKLGHPADLDWLTENREQLFAEAYHRVVTLEESTWEYPEELGDQLTELQESRMDTEGHEEELITWYANFAPLIEDGVTVLQAYTSVWRGNSGYGDMPPSMPRKIGGLFRRLLYLEKKKTMVNGERSNRWFPTDKTFSLIEQYSIMGKDHSSLQRKDVSENQNEKEAEVASIIRRIEPGD